MPDLDPEFTLLLGKSEYCWIKIMLDLTPEDSLFLGKIRIL